MMAHKENWLSRVFNVIIKLMAKQLKDRLKKGERRGKRKGGSTDTAIYTGM
jgi:hypothetical protein